MGDFDQSQSLKQPHSSPLLNVNFCDDSTPALSDRVPCLPSSPSLPLLHSQSNGTSVATVKASKSSLIDDFGDAGSYSLCGLCALLFAKYFPEERHKAFLQSNIKKLVAYFNLPFKVSLTMNAMLEGEGGDLNSFIKLIHKEMEKKSVHPNRIVEDLLVFAVKDGVYDARLRVVIIKLACFLDISIELVEMYEHSLVELLSDELNSEDEADKKRRNLNKKIKRYALIALASIGGGAIIGLTGGLSAPLLAAGATALTSGAAILGTPAGVAIIGSLFGVAGAGLTGYKMNKRVGNIEEFAFEQISTGRALSLTIAISGWISEDSPDAFSRHWLSLANSQEQYSLRYESCYLLELGRALDYFLGFAISMAAQEALKYTLLSGIIAAIAWPATLVTISSVIDNPWGVCISRSAEVGKFLADLLLTRQQGQRPVTLIGFSLGARVIFFCLEELSTRKDSEGIIENVILLGAPVSASPDRWSKFFPIVSGRIVNGYCRDDWLLKFLYRTSTATLRIAGLQEVNLKHKRLENHDLTDLIKGHMDYAKKMEEVLERVGIRVEKNEENDKSEVVNKDQEKDKSTGEEIEISQSSEKGFDENVNTETEQTDNKDEQVAPKEPNGQIKTV